MLNYVCKTEEEAVADQSESS